VREKYCWLAGGYWLVLIWCERKILLAGCSEQSACLRNISGEYLAKCEILSLFLPLEVLPNYQLCEYVMDGTSYEHIETMVLTFREACEVMGFVGSDKTIGYYLTETGT